MKFIGKVTESQKEVILAKLAEIEAEFGSEFKPFTVYTLKHLEIEFSTRMRSTAGRAITNLAGIKCSRIQLHARLFEKYPERMMTTFLHEVAHVLAATQHGACQGHGLNWKVWMIKFGLQPKRCHNMEVKEFQSKRALVRYQYDCDCGKSYNVTPHTHKKVVTRVNNMINHYSMPKEEAQSLCTGIRCGICRLPLKLQEKPVKLAA